MLNLNRPIGDLYLFLLITANAVPPHPPVPGRWCPRFGKGPFRVHEWCERRAEEHNPSDPAKGSTQFPVMSATSPNTSGDRIAASADPEFMSPAAVPEYFPAMSIGIDHIGPMIISAKKNAPPSANTIAVIFVVKKTGSMQTKDARNANMATLRRAFLRSRVLCRMRSLSSPPKMLPITPGKYTAAEKNADSRVLKPYSF